MTTPTPEGIAEERRARIGMAVVFWTWITILGGGLVVMLAIAGAGR
ncbi:hypothetical protein PFZ55_48365 [Streptomyces sp. MS2A]|nr:hypothetical protein [Streptomyces sp. MS2A]